MAPKNLSHNKSCFARNRNTKSYPRRCLLYFASVCRPWNFTQTGTV